jgi:hypothetical protein
MDSHLLATADQFFQAFAANQSPLKLLTFFSTARPLSIQHAPRTCPNPPASRLEGLIDIRSYFDLIATHWERKAIILHSSSVIPDSHTVTTSASVTWRWKKSGRTWNEDFSCTLEFDDHLKICDFVITTESSPTTCVMRAVDTDTDTPSPRSPSSTKSSIIEVASVSAMIAQSLSLWLH